MRNSRKEQDRMLRNSEKQKTQKLSKSEVVGKRDGGWKLDCGCVDAVAGCFHTTLPSSFHAACYVIPWKQGKGLRHGLCGVKLLSVGYLDGRGPDIGQR